MAYITSRIELVVDSNRFFAASIFTLWIYSNGVLEYDSGVQRRFMTRVISKRGKVLAELMGLV